MVGEYGKGERSGVGCLDNISKLLYRPDECVLHLSDHVNDMNNLSTARFYSGDGMLLGIYS